MEKANVFQPVAKAERYVALDAMRGIALLGVLLVNLHDDFQTSLPDRLLTFHTNPGAADRITDLIIASVFEFKAFTLLSLLFGAGMAAFAERSTARGADFHRFLVRRLLVLLAIGLGHLLLVWNGDILTLYAACGFLLVPLLRFSPAFLLVAGSVALALPYLLPFAFAWPTEETLIELAAEAARVYAGESYWDVFTFHWRETQLLIVPLLVASLPRTWGLMAIGAAAWRAKLFQRTGEYTTWLRTVAVLGIVVGGTATALSVHASSTGRSSAIWPEVVEAASSLPLALAYAAILLLAMRYPRAKGAAKPFAALGQMALTNYLMQSVLLSLLFYGYGLGLFGQLGSAAATGVGLILYAAQLVTSRAWLRRFRFGPVEWLWRSLTYGHCQHMGLADQE